MPAIAIKLDGPEELTPIPPGAKWHHVTEPLEVALVLGGMVSGAPSIMMRIALPDGSFAIVETSVALLEMLTGAIRGRLEFLASGPAGGVAQ